MEDVLKSSIGIPTEGYLHQLHFSYPIDGGFQSIVDAFAGRVPGRVVTDWCVGSVERKGEEWVVVSSLGEERRYRTLVSKVPFHEMLKVWKDGPAADVARAHPTLCT